MAKFNERLKDLRKEKDISQAEFAKYIGISKSSINMYERGEREPGIETLEAIADYFNVDMDYLLGKSEHRSKYDWFVREKDGLVIDNILPLPEVRSIPIIGTIACGDPINATENVDGYVSVPTTIDADFALRCKGDSMVGARILDGDIVFIRQQPDVENGEIAAVLIDGEATLKRVHKQNGSLVLYPENSAYAPIVLVGAELENVRILGKAVSFISNVR